MLKAFIASEAGKVRGLFTPITDRCATNLFVLQQFEITFSNNLTDSKLAIFVHIDGRVVKRKYLRASSNGRFRGPKKSACSILPLKFQELQLVGMFSSIFLSFNYLLDVSRKIQTWKMHPPLPKWGL